MISGSGNVQALNSSIVVLEESANAKFDEITTETCTGANTGYVTKVNFTFTPSVESEYMFIWAGEVKTEDESDTGVKGARFFGSTGSTSFLTENHSELVGTANDNTYFTVGGVAFETVETIAHGYQIEIDGDGSLDEFCLRNAALVAIPFGDFANVYSDSQTTQTLHTGTSFSDTTVVINQSVNAADHLILAGVELSNEAPQGAGRWQLVSDGSLFPANNFNDRDEDSSEYYLNFAVHGKTLTAGSKNFEIEGSSSSTSGTREGAIRNAYLVVAEIPVVAVVTLTQDDFRWYNDETTVTLTDLWGTVITGDNEDITALPFAMAPPVSGDKLRLQINLTVTGVNMGAGTQDFILEYKEGTDQDCSTGSWTAIGAISASGTDWRFFDNTSLTDGIVEVNQITTSDVVGDYVESDPTGTNPNAVNIDQSGEWDFAIETGTTFKEATSYAFRLIQGGTGVTVAYTAGDCPTLETAPGTGDIMRHGNFFVSGAEKGFFWAN